MIVCILVLVLLTPVTFLPLVLASFTPSALDEMGVCLELPQPALESTDVHLYDVARASASSTLKLHAVCG
jgi:hypothetical protein